MFGGGLDRIRISIEGIDADAYKAMAGVELDWESFVKNIKNLYDNRGDCEIYIKTVDAAVDSQEKKERFFETFGSLCDKIFIEHISPIWPGYDELNSFFTLSDKKMMSDLDMDIREIRVCLFPFYQMFIHSDGMVSPCCPDWQRKLLLGNVKTTALSDIWNGEAYNTLLKDMLKCGRQCRDLCSRCSYPDSNANDNIDDYAGDLLGKFCSDR